MQVSGSLETATESPEIRKETGANVEGVVEIKETDANDEDSREESEGNDICGKNSDDERVADISGRHVEFSLLENADESLKGLYVYRNVFNLIPSSVGRLGRLRTLKFFGNEIDLFPSELGNLKELEYLQVKLSSPGFTNGLSLNKLKGLKELELTKVPRQSSVLAVLTEIAGLSRLKKLSICYFSIRYLPPEIGCLTSLENLELSFNKIKSLPSEICYLKSLVSLKVAHNKLVDLPSGLTSLQKLESMDLSNNRLTSLGSLDLYSMPKLQTLNLQYNKLKSYCQIPSWISCNLEGNGKDSSNDDFISSSVEMDIYETSFQDHAGRISCKGSHRNPPSGSNGLSSNSRCFSARRPSMRWKRRQHYLQHKARQERLNNSRKWKGEGLVEGLTQKSDGSGKQGDGDMTASDGLKEDGSSIVSLDGDERDDPILHVEADSENSVITSEESKSSENHASVDVESVCNEEQTTLGGHNASSASSNDEVTGVDDDLSLKRLGTATKAANKSKRHSDRDLDNLKPCKLQRRAGDATDLSKTYSSTSFCRSEDILPDGFYDAGRDRPFMPLGTYEQVLNLDSREVILVDREKDEELDAVTFSARALISRLKRLNGLTKGGEQGSFDNLQMASLLALFVSDHFGGSDRSAMIERTRKAVSGSNYQKPFVCTCSTGHTESSDSSTKQVLGVAGETIFTDICEKALHSIKLRRNSIVVPIGTLQFGVCRHRALLMKYLCDRMEPPVPCELVRGYLNFSPHAWNVVPVKRGGSWVRMIVDACHPHEIKAELDPEFFCRYIPLFRVNAPTSAEKDIDLGISFPSIPSCHEIEKFASSSLIRCKLGSVEAISKVRILEVSGASAEEIRNFEYSCLGEVRMLGVLNNPCIVKMYGHQISSKWLTSADGNQEHRVLQSSIIMEYIKGGSLKSHIEKLAKAGEKIVPVDMALRIARDIACAIVELHSKHIIHRDIKSENILIDLTAEKAEGAPVVKLCDFDRAVPLRSSLHTCCIAQLGTPPPDVCVGTPRWMAPEVLRAMHEHCLYGLEVDIWSYGCLLLELLTLQVPYSGFSELQIHDALQMGERPHLPDELEALRSLDEHPEAQHQTGSDLPKADFTTLKFLIDLFYRCTMETPSDRPTAGDIYEMLLAQSRELSPSEKVGSSIS